MNYFRCLISIMAVIICTGFSFFSSKDEPPQKHLLNYSGQLYNRRGGVIEVENISIGGKLHAIKMYEIPADITSNDPMDDVTIFDLDAIYSIEPALYSAGKTQFKNKEYIEIVVTLQDEGKTQLNYLIPSKEKVMCAQITTAGSLPKEVSFNALKKVIITGKCERQNNKNSAHTTALPTTKLCKN